MSASSSGETTSLRMPRRLTINRRAVNGLIQATRAAAGLGLLPCFMADRHDDLVRVLPDDVDGHRVGRPDLLVRHGDDLPATYLPGEVKLHRFLEGKASNTRNTYSVTIAPASDPQARRTVDPEQHLTKSRNSPYRGMELPGAVRHTVYRGARVVADGAPARPYRHPALTETGERA